MVDDADVRNDLTLGVYYFDCKSCLLRFQIYERLWGRPI